MKKFGSFTGNERKTTLIEIERSWFLTYHDTIVCRYNEVTRTLTINTGGWHTFTTVRRINQFCETFNLPVSASRTFNYGERMRNAYGYFTSREQIIDLPYDEDYVICFEEGK